MNYLAVCDGNVARSQFLHAILVHNANSEFFAKFSDSPDYMQSTLFVQRLVQIYNSVKSCGTDITTPQRYGKPIAEVCDIINANLYISWEDQTVKCVSPELVDWADFIFVLPARQYPDYLLKSGKNIYWNERDPGVRQGKADFKETLEDSFHGIRHRVFLQFPQNYNNQYESVMELRALTGLERKLSKVRSADPAEYTRLRNEGIMEILERERSHMIKLPYEIASNPPSGYSKEALDAYEHKLSLLLLLSYCPFHLVANNLGLGASSWCFEQLEMLPSRKT